jgi:hypothetical protein
MLKPANGRSAAPAGGTTTSRARGGWKQQARVDALG